MKKIQASCLIKGFLLLELMLSMLLLSVALIGILNGYLTFMKARQANRVHAEIRLLQQQKIGELMADKTYQEGHTEGSFELNHDFRWTLDIKSTDIKSLFQLRLAVTGYEDTVPVCLYLREETDDDQALE